MELRVGIISRNDYFVYFVKSIDVMRNVNCEVCRNPDNFTAREKNKDIVLIDYDTFKNIDFKIDTIKNFYDTTIIFVTTQPLLRLQQNQNRFGINAHFIYKQHLPKELRKIIFEKVDKRKSDSIIVKMNKDAYRLYYHEIYAIYPDDHYLNFLVLSYDEPIRSRIWLNEIAEQLDKNGFVKTRGKTYINLHLIKYIDYENNTVYFINGHHEIFSRRNHKEIARRFLEEV